MSADRRIARTVGVLFLVGTVAGALSLILTDPILTAPDYLAQVAVNRERMVAGVLLVLVMGFALAMVPVVFWPVGKRHSETLAMGYVVFRGALETVTYIIGALGWLLLIALSQEPDSGLLAGFIQTTERVVWDQLIALPFVLSALLFYVVLYKARLVPRWLSGWGLLGAALYIVAPLASMLGGSLGVLMAPLAVQEMVMAAWLIAKGFEPVPPARSEQAGPSPQSGSRSADSTALA
jgi:hypothetical protein